MSATGLLPLMLLLLGGHVGPRLGLPPLPEDPLLARMAPAEPLWYFSCAGVAEPDPRSSNQTEQTLAEPEVRDFLHAVNKALSDAIRQGAPPTPQGELLGAEGPKLIRALLTHPAAAFVSKLAVGRQGLEVSGGIVIATGAQTDELKAILEKLQQTIVHTAGTTTNGFSSQWREFPSPPGVPRIEWGFRDSYLIVGVGESSAEATWSRRRGPPPAWLTTLKKKLAIERISTVQYVNVKKAFAEAESLVCVVQARMLMEALDLGNVRQFTAVSGLDGAGYVYKSWLRVDGKPGGALTLLGPEPLSAADLAPIPKDATFAIALRVNPVRNWQSAVAAVSRIDAPVGDQLREHFKSLESALMRPIKVDFLDTLGDSMCIYNSPNEGGLLVTGLTIVAPLKDRDRLLKTNERLVHLLQRTATIAPTDPQVVAINESTFKKQKIYSVDLNDSQISAPLTPTWCITDKQLIVSLSPQNIRAILSRDPAAGSLADLPVVAEKLKSDRPVLLGYEDTAAILKITYPLLQIFGAAEFKDLRDDGIDLDPGSIPSMGSLIHHVRPSVSTLSREDDGLVFVSRQSLPIDLTPCELIALFTSDGIVLPAF